MLKRLSLSKSVRADAAAARTESASARELKKLCALKTLSEAQLARCRERRRGTCPSRRRRP